jgi:hypothetical protein
MEISKAISLLEKEWEDGFFYKLRSGSVCEADYHRCLEILSSVELTGQSHVETRFVSLVWIIPSFINWQKDRLIESGVPEASIDALIEEFENRMELIFGMP